MVNEQDSRSRNNREKETETELMLLGDLGVQDRKFGNLGLIHAPVRSLATVDPTSGDAMYAYFIDYPVKGLGLEYFLSTTSPNNQNASLYDRRFGTRSDWLLPETAEMDEDDSILYDAHKELEGFNDFDKDHRESWLHTHLDDMFNDYFTWRDEIRFVDAEVFVSHHGIVNPNNAQSLPWNFFHTASRLYRDEGDYKKRPLTFVDPIRGFEVSHTSIIAGFGSTHRMQPPGHLISERLNGFTTQIELGDLTNKGYYEEADVRTFFPRVYAQGAMRPLLAWREREGKRSFLTQNEAMVHFPEFADENDGADVMLGRVVAAYMQPEIRLPRKMKLPTLRERDPNELEAAQLPVVVSLPDTVVKLLGTELVTNLQANAVQKER